MRTRKKDAQAWRKQTTEKDPAPNQSLGLKYGMMNECMPINAGVEAVWKHNMNRPRHKRRCLDGSAGGPEGNFTTAPGRFGAERSS